MKTQGIELSRYMNKNKSLTEETCHHYTFPVTPNNLLFHKLNINFIIIVIIKMNKKKFIMVFRQVHVFFKQLKWKNI